MNIHDAKDPYRVPGVLNRLGCKHVYVSGRFWRTQCPVHGSKDLDLSISMDTGVAQCFSEGCSMHSPGDLITLVQKSLRLSFKEALEWILGTQVSETEWKPKPPKTRRARALKAWDIYRKGSVEEAYAYWRKRGLSDYTIAMFGLRYTVVEPYAGSFFAERHGRLIIPIVLNRQIWAITMRREDEDELHGPKYMTIGSMKQLIFNGDVLKQPNDIVYITEGQADAMSVVDTGRAAVSCRDAVGIEPVFRYAKRVVIIADNDEMAGAKYAQRIQQEIGRAEVVVPPLKDANEMHQAKLLDLWLREVEGGQSYVRTHAAHAAIPAQCTTTDSRCRRQGQGNAVGTRAAIDLQPHLLDLWQHANH